MSTHAAVEPEPSLSQFLQQQDMDKVKHFSLAGRRYNLRFGNSRHSAIMHVGLAMSDEHMHTPFLEIFVYHDNANEVTVHLVKHSQMPESLCYRNKIKSAVTSNVVNTVLGLLRSLPSTGAHRTCLEELAQLQLEQVTSAAEPAQDPRETLCRRLMDKYNLFLDPSKITYMGADGIDYDDHVMWNNCDIDRIPVRFRDVTGYFNCGTNRLVSLRNSPVHVSLSFNCSDNRLTTLEHAPGHVGGDVYCTHNRLTSLRHAPGYVGGDVYFSGNYLPLDARKPVGVHGRFVLGNQKHKQAHAAAEPHTGIAGVFATLHRMIPRQAVRVRTGNDEYPVAWLYTMPTKDGGIRVHLQRPRGDIGYLYTATVAVDGVVQLVRVCYGSVIAVFADAVSAQDLAHKLVVAAVANHSRKRTQAASEPQHKLSAFDFAEDLHRRMRDGSPVRIGQRLFLMFSSRLEGRDFVQFHFQLPGDPGEVRVNVHENGVVQSTVYEPPRVGCICQQARVPDIDHGPASAMLKKFLLSLKINCNTDMYGDYDNIYELLEKLPGLATSARAAAEPDSPGDHIGTVDDVVKILRTVSRPHNEVRVHGDVRLVYAHVTVVIEIGEPTDPDLRNIGADAVFVSVWCGPSRLLAKEVDDSRQVRQIGLAVNRTEHELARRNDVDLKVKVLLELHRRGAPSEQPPPAAYIAELRRFAQEEFEATAAAEPEPKRVRMHLFDELVALVPGTKRVVVDGAEVKFGRAKSVVPAYDAEMFVHVTTPSGTTKFRVYEFSLPPGNTAKPEIDVVVQELESKRKLWLLVRKAQNTRQLLAGIVKYAVLAHKAPFPGGHEVEI